MPDNHSKERIKGIYIILYFEKCPLRSPLRETKEKALGLSQPQGWPLSNYVFLPPVESIMRQVLG